jgi:hypothetical protein
MPSKTPGAVVEPVHADVHLRVGPVDELAVHPDRVRLTFHKEGSPSRCRNASCLRLGRRLIGCARAQSSTRNAGCPCAARCVAEPAPTQDRHRGSSSVLVDQDAIARAEAAKRRDGARREGGRLLPPRGRARSSPSPPRRRGPILSEGRRRRLPGNVRPRTGCRRDETIDLTMLLERAAAALAASRQVRKRPDSSSSTPCFGSPGLPERIRRRRPLSHGARAERIANLRQDPRAPRRRAHPNPRPGSGCPFRAHSRSRHSSACELAERAPSPARRARASSGATRRCVPLAQPPARRSGGRGEPDQVAGLRAAGAWASRRRSRRCRGRAGPGRSGRAPPSAAGTGDGSGAKPVESRLGSSRDPGLRRVRGTRDLVQVGTAVAGTRAITPGRRRRRRST